MRYFSVYLFSQLTVALYETDMLYKSKENYVIIHYAKYFEIIFYKVVFLC